MFLLDGSVLLVKGFVQSHRLRIWSLFVFRELLLRFASLSEESSEHGRQFLKQLGPAIRLLEQRYAVRKLFD